MAATRATARRVTDAARATSPLAPMNSTADAHDDDDDPGVLRRPPCPRAAAGQDLRSLTVERVVPVPAAAGRAPAPGLRTMFASAARPTLAAFGVTLR